MRPSPSARLVRSLGLLALAAAVALLLGTVTTAGAAGQSGPVARIAIPKKKTTAAGKRRKRPSALMRCLRKARKAHSKKARAAKRRACLRAAKKAKKKATAARRKTAPALPLPPAGGTNPFGADVFGVALGGAIQNEDSTTLGRDLDAIAGTHTHWVRVDINWAVIQGAGPSSYNWAPIDRVVQGATARGVKVLGTILYTPGWAHPSGASATYGPDPATYANFAATAVRHYAAMGVHAYEVWNEPNITAFWTPKPDPAAYTRVLKAAYPAIKGADPTATVLSGGTAPAPSDGTQIAPIDFLQGIYANGGAGSFDAVSHHPYCWPANPGDPQGWSAWYQMYGTNPSLRSVMTANGDAAKKIWATEFGAPTNGPSGSYVSEATQASMLTRAYQLYRTYDWGGPLFFYQGRDQSANDTSTRENFFGLTHYDFTPKPAYTAYQQATSS
jgi:polysaccharide biosynthesis protein PslG